MSTATALDRSTEQRMAALRHANEIRTKRARLKRALKAGHLTPATVLFSLDYDWLQTMRVREVLLATPKLGRIKVESALNRCAISPRKTIAGMSDRQRRCLLEFLAERHPQARVGWPAA